MTETKYKCQGCGADLGESQVEKYGEGLCHVVPVQDRHGDLEPNPCGPVVEGETMSETNVISKCCKCNTYEYERPLNMDELEREKNTKVYTTKNTVTVYRCANCNKLVRNHE